MMNIVKFIKLQILRWLGHAERMPKESLPYRIHEEMDGIRKQRTPMERWLKSAEGDLGKINIRKCWVMLNNRNERRHIVWKVKAYPGL